MPSGIVFEPRERLVQHWSEPVASPLKSAKVLLRQSLLSRQRSSPVPTECNATLFEFSPVDGRQVVAAFDGGAITSDAGAMLLGETDRAIRLTSSTKCSACSSRARAYET